MNLKHYNYYLVLDLEATRLPTSCDKFDTPYYSSRNCR
jgi:hypothetical protein